MYHQSVREFFLESNHRFSFTRTEAEIYASIACLTYLSFTNHAETMTGSRSGGEIYQDDFRLMKDNPFLRYAAVYWSHHVAQVEGNLDLWELFLSWSNSNNFGICSRIFWYFRGTGQFPNQPTPMHILCFLGLEWLIRRALLQWVTMVHSCDSLGRTPLHWAAVNGNEKIIQFLIEQGANQDKTDRNTLTPLELALEFGNHQAVDILMGNDDDFEIKGKWLEMAVIGGHTSVVQLLLDRGANANALCPITTFGSPLHAAAYLGHEELVGLLLDAGANVDYFSDKYGTALQIAAFEGNVAVVVLLLDRKANRNTKASITGTVLQSGAQRGSVQIVRELIRKGADVRAPAGETLGTAMYLAKSPGHEPVEAILENVGALLEGPLTERRESRIDPGIEFEVELTKHSVSKGGQAVFGWQLKRFRSEVHGGLFSKNEKKLRWALKVSVPYFESAVKLGREGLVIAVVDVAMGIVQDAVESGYETGLTMVMTAWTKALLTVINDGKKCLVERALQVCIGKFKTLIEEDKWLDAKNLMVAGIELYIQMCQTGSQELVELVAKVWAKAGDDMMKWAFRVEIIAILDFYCIDWAKAAEQRNSVKVNAVGTAGLGLLLAAVGPINARELSREITTHFLAILQTVMHSRNPDLKNWVLSIAQPLLQVTIKRHDAESTAAVVGVGLEFLLAVIEDNEYNELREVILAISTKVLGEIERLDLLDSARATVEHLAEEKFNACAAGGHRGRRVQLDRLEGKLFEVLDSVNVAGNQIPQLATVIEKLKEAVKGYAREAGLEFQRP